MNVLALGAHADDIELGCGGTLLKHHAAGDAVNLYVVTDSAYTDRHGRSRTAAAAADDAIRAAELLGGRLHFGGFTALDLRATSKLVFAIEDVIDTTRADRIYTHFPGDTHLDHAAVCQATLIAARRVDQVLAYRSNVQTSPRPFAPTAFVDISATFEAKLQLLDCFRSEAEKMSRWKPLFSNLAFADGAANGFRCAEAFEVLWWRER